MFIATSETMPAVDCWEDENGAVVRRKTSAIRLCGRSAGKAFKVFSDAHGLVFWKTVNPFTHHHVEVCDETALQAILTKVNGAPPLLNGRPTVWLGDFRRDLNRLQDKKGRGRRGGSVSYWMTVSCPFLGGETLKSGQETTGDKRRYIDRAMAQKIKKKIRDGKFPEQWRFDGVYEERDGDRLLGLVAARREFRLKHGQLKTAIALEEIESKTKRRPGTRALRRVVWESAVRSWMESEKQRREPTDIPGFETARRIAELIGASTAGKAAFLGSSLATFRKAKPSGAVLARSSVRRRSIWLYELSALLPYLGYEGPPGAGDKEHKSTRPQPTVEVTDDPRFIMVRSIVAAASTMKVSAIQKEVRRRAGTGIRRQTLMQILGILREDGTYRPLPNHRPRSK